MQREIRKRRNGFSLTKSSLLADQEQKKPAVQRWGDSSSFYRLLPDPVLHHRAEVQARPSRAPELPAYARSRDSPPARAPAPPPTHPPAAAAAGERRPVSRTRAPSPAIEASTSAKPQHSSRVDAKSAYLWKVLASVVAGSRVPEERCCMGWMVDARRWVKSPELVPAMRNCFGNVTAYGLGDTAMEIRRRPLDEVVVKGVLGLGWMVDVRLREALLTSNAWPLVSNQLVKFV